jgi:hypothetical protein
LSRHLTCLWPVAAEEKNERTACGVHAELFVHLRAIIPANFRLNRCGFRPSTEFWISLWIVRVFRCTARHFPWLISLCRPSPDATRHAGAFPSLRTGPRGQGLAHRASGSNALIANDARYDRRLSHLRVAHSHRPHRRRNTASVDAHSRCPFRLRRHNSRAAVWRGQVRPAH